MKDTLVSLAVTCVKLLTPVLIALLGLLAKRLHDLIQARARNETMKGVLDRLQLTAFAVVTEVQQTIVDNLDENAPKESLEKARDAAVASLKTHLGARGLDEARKVLGVGDAALDKILATYVESQVHQLKARAARAVVPRGPIMPKLSHGGVTEGALA